MTQPQEASLYQRTAEAGGEGDHLTGIVPRKAQGHPKSRESGDSASTMLRALLATEPLTYDSLPHLQSPPSSLCLTLQDPHAPGGRQEAVPSCSPYPVAAAGVSYPENAWNRGAVEPSGSVNAKKL